MQNKYIFGGQNIKYIKILTQWNIYSYIIYNIENIFSIKIKIINFGEQIPSYPP